MDKLYKTVLATVTAASVLVCSACAGAPAADQVQEQLLRYSSAAPVRALRQQIRSRTRMPEKHCRR